MFKSADGPWGNRMRGLVDGVRWRDGVPQHARASQDLITLNEDPKAAARAGVNGGVDLFGFRLRELRDLNAAITEIEVAGGTLMRRGEHAAGVPFAYVRDPDGYLIELLS